MPNLGRIGRALGITLAGVSTLAGTSALAVLRRPLPQTKGTLRLPGLAGRVQVLRDRWGVPHIYAGTSGDLFMAQGFVHAQDRLWQLELNRRTGHGQLAELFGPVALSSDRFIRTLGFGRVAQREVALLDDETRAALSAYVAGINAFIEQAGRKLPLEFSLLRHRPRPWELADVLAWAKILALNLSENWGGELLRARLVALVGEERAAALEPTLLGQPLSVPEGALFGVTLGADAAQLAADAAPFTGAQGLGQGSNAWAVSGARSASGRPLLANDPHLGLTMPSLWYEMHLEGGGYSVTGASLPGAPGIVIGHNARVAWGVTNGMTDVQDLYVERFDAADPLRYQWRDGWEHAELVREEIRVKGQPQPHVEAVRVTRHGPVISPLLDSSLYPVVSSPMAQGASQARGAATEEVSADLSIDGPANNRRGTALTFNATTAPDRTTDYGLQTTDEATTAPDRTTDYGLRTTDEATTAPDRTTDYELRTTEALALRWTALEPSRIARAVLELNRASDWTQFRAALAHWTVPPQNFVYADVDGHVGYALGGAIPLRAPGADGRLPLPGWSGDYEWRGTIPTGDLPATLDPPQGYVVTANNRIAGDDYAHPIAAEYLCGYRAARIGELLRATPRHDAASFARIHRDLTSAPGLALARLAPRLPADTPLSAAARDELARWDGMLTADSVAGTIYASLRYHLLRVAYHELETLRLQPIGLGAFAGLPANMYLDRALPDMLRRLEAHDDAWLSDGHSWDGVLAEAWTRTLDELRAKLGDDVRMWRYGRTHTLTLRHPLGAVPALARIFNRGPWPMGGDLDTVCMGHAARDTAAGPTYVAPSYRQICDPSDWDQSRSIHPTGQSGHPGSRHYSDMARLWRAGDYHPMLWSRSQVEAATVATLNLEPS